MIYYDVSGDGGNSVTQYLHKENALTVARILSEKEDVGIVKVCVSGCIAVFDDGEEI